MAMRTNSEDDTPESYLVRQANHLAPPLVAPDSPRPQKNPDFPMDSGGATTLTIPTNDTPKNQGLGDKKASSSSVVRLESIIVETTDK